MVMEKPQDYSLKLRCKHYSAIGIMSTDSIEDVFITDGSVDGEFFLYYVRKQLLPKIQPFNGYNSKSVVVMDNAAIHHIDLVAFINSVGAFYRHTHQVWIQSSRFLEKSNNIYKQMICSFTQNCQWPGSFWWHLVQKNVYLHMQVMPKSVQSTIISINVMLISLAAQELAFSAQ